LSCRDRGAVRPAVPAPGGTAGPAAQDMAEALELLLLTDVHHGPSRVARDAPPALDGLTSVLRRLEREPATLLLDLGDRINDVGPEQDLRHLEEVASAFALSTKERH